MKPQALLLPISIMIALIFAVLPMLGVLPVQAGDINLQSDETPTPFTDVVEETDIPSSPTPNFADTEEPPPPTPVYEETATPDLPTPQWTETITPTALTPTPTSILPDPTPTSLPVSNLLVNGSFEDGISGWEQLQPEQIVEGGTHHGDFAVRIGSNQEMRQGWVTVTPGIPYLLTAWMKWSEFEGTDWGYPRLRVVDNRWSRIAEQKHLQREIPQNEWGQLVLEFTPDTDRILISAGVFGPQDNADLLFDDFTLAPKPVEPPPVASASLKITAPTMSGTYETSDSAVIIGGTANSAVRLVWDNIDTDSAGVVSGDAPIKAWQTSKIDLKPGRNELLFTSQNAEGKLETARLVVNRKISGPAISAVSLSANQIPVYEKVEVRFQLATAAQNYFYAFDTNPPPGVSPGVGVTAEGVFTSPSGQVLVQPGVLHDRCCAHCFQRTGPLSTDQQHLLGGPF
jgi:hypothetical protein